MKTKYLIVLMIATFLKSNLGYAEIDIYQSQINKNWASHSTNFGALAQTQSEKYADTYLNIAFYEDDRCEAMINYTQSAPEPDKRVPVGPTTAKIHLRIDKLEPWVVEAGNANITNELSASGTRALLSIHFSVPLEFLAELASGEKLRMKYDANESTGRFDLAGSSVSIKQSLQFCLNKMGDSDDSYFSSGKNTKEGDEDKSYF